jgi:hypothetical protein
MAKKPRGGRGKRGAKSKIAKHKVPPRTAHLPEAPPPLDARLRSLAPSSRPTTAAGMAAVWDQGSYGAGAYSAKPEALEGVGAQVANAEVLHPETVSIAPTIYPQEPGGTITVQNYITINIYSNEFRAFEDTMGQLLAEMRKSNEIAGEVRDKLNAEINAGMNILKSPKPDRQVIEVWLLRPLKYIIEKAVGALIGKLAGTALEMLIRMIG